MTAPEYTEGVCEDGAAILKDGLPMTISEVLAELNAAPTIKSDIDEFMRRLGPHWFLEQGWFPASKA